jgi:hypothetical protein
MKITIYIPFIIGVVLILLSRVKIIIFFVRKIFGTLIQMFVFGNAALMEVFNDNKSKNSFTQLGMIFVGIMFILVGFVLVFM